MAERRMFAKTIIDSDAFLDMPQTTQLLYFHLSMRADDDGFINNPKSIMRNVKCSEDDFKLLYAKKFIITFESGIVVIKHWKIHNYIANDRYRETKYKEEKSLLELDENKAYTKLDNPISIPCIQIVDEVKTQVRLGKDRIGKVNKDNINNHQLIVDMFNETCVSLPRVTKISSARKKAINARLDEYTIEDFELLFYMAEDSAFLTGKKQNQDWKATFDWLLKDSNMAKTLDGNYTSGKDKNSYGVRTVPGTTETDKFTAERIGDISTDIEESPFGV